MTARIKFVPFIFLLEDFRVDVAKAIMDTGLQPTQAEAACGLAIGSFASILSGKNTNPKISTLLKICNALDLNPVIYWALDDQSVDVNE